MAQIIVNLWFLNTIIITWKCFMAENMLFLVKYSFGKDRYVNQQSSYSMNEIKIIIDTWQLHQYNCLKNIMHVPRENKSLKYLLIFYFYVPILPI